MKSFLSVLVILFVSGIAVTQSGRRSREITVPLPPPPVEEPSPKPKVSPEEVVVTAERDEEYRCSDDGSLERILDADEGEQVLSSKQVDTRLVITSKPQPVYTKEARRLGVQGFVRLKTLLAADSKVSRVRVVKGLPAGLTANAIRAACKMKFKPAIKDGQPVAQWVTAEYVFRLADSSIFSP
jgi:periplasmic protein TonB